MGVLGDFSLLKEIPRGDIGDVIVIVGDLDFLSLFVNEVFWSNFGDAGVLLGLEGDGAEGDLLDEETFRDTMGEADVLSLSF